LSVMMQRDCVLAWEDSRTDFVICRLTRQQLTKTAFSISFFFGPLLTNPQQITSC
jgi:hypothetical protein